MFWLMAALCLASVAAFGQGVPPVESKEARADRLLEEGRLALARMPLADASAAFLQGLHEPASGPGWHLLPDHVRADVVHSLGMAYDSMSGATKDFFAHPGMQQLLAFAQEWAGKGKDAATDVAHQLFFRKEADGWKPDWVRAAVSAPLIPVAGAAAIEGAKDIYNYGADLLSSDAERRAKAKLPVHVMHRLVEAQIDPVTGAAYAALVVPHPTDKNEKTVLYGLRQGSFDGEQKQIYAGGRLSTVREQHKSGNWNRSKSDAGDATGRLHTGGAEDLPAESGKAIDDALESLRKANPQGVVYADTSPGGPRVAYRATYDKTGDEPAGKFLNHLREKFLRKGALNTESYWRALTMLSSSHATILKPVQAYRELTNYNVEGHEGKNKNGIFSHIDGFGSKESSVVMASLRAEVDKALRETPNPTATQRATLQRAVQIAAIAKGIDKDGAQKGELAKLQEKIAGGGGGQAQAAGINGDRLQRRPEAFGGGPSIKDGAENPAPMPEKWTKQEVENISRTEARSIARELKLFTADSQTDIANVIDVMSRKVHEKHGLPMTDAMKSVTDGIMAAAGSAHDTRSGMGDDLTSGHWKTNDVLFDRIDEAARKRKAAMGKIAGLDDLDTLMKLFGSFDDSKHPRVGKGQHGGGEFAPGSGAGGGDLAAEPAQRTQNLSSLHPVRAVPDLASNLGFSGAMELAGHYIPKGQAVQAFAQKTIAGAPKGSEGIAWNLAQKFLPAPVKAVATVGRLGGMVVASIAGSVVGEAAGDAAVTTAYRVAGSRAPIHAAPEEPIGRTLANFAGQAIGTVAGTAAGSGIASIATGAAGGWAGGVAGEHIYDWLSGYGQKHTSRVMQKYLQPQGPSGPSAGEVGSHLVREVLNARVPA